MFGLLRRKYREWLLSRQEVMSAIASAVNQERTLALVGSAIHTLTDVADKQNLNWPTHPNGLLYEAIKRVYVSPKYSMVAARYPFPISPIEDQDGTFLGFVYNCRSDLPAMRWMLAAQWLEQPDVKIISPKGN